MPTLPLKSCDSNKLGASSRKSGKAGTTGIEIGTLVVFVCFPPATHTHAHTQQQIKISLRLPLANGTKAYTKIAFSQQNFLVGEYLKK